MMVTTFPRPVRVMLPSRCSWNLRVAFAVAVGVFTDLSAALMYVAGPGKYSIDALFGIALP